jgi:hypothetical protein
MRERSKTKNRKAIGILVSFEIGPQLQIFSSMKSVLIKKSSTDSPAKKILYKSDFAVQFGVWSPPFPLVKNLSF